MTVLSARDLRKAFGGVVAVGGVSLDVEDGEIRAVIGPNGAGKSTCFDLLSGWILPDGGTVTLLGRDVTGWTAPRLARAGLGRSFQRSNAFLGLTVLENVLAAVLARAGHARRLWRHVAGYAAERRRALEVLEAVGLGAWADAPARTLPYGDQKRLDIAIALAVEPRVLILDEPLAGLAPAERTGILDLIRWLARDQGKTVILSEHDVDAVLATADRITVLHQGQVLTEGTAAEVVANAAVRAAFLGN
ncbi:ABC transporter ATP-binding protein [Caldinitratiruptor microaerophilus]|uniref:ABC transporter ATP-binding protein n=1 Tax=Caldinitratiruptor microaerophilus TaxID=671077 RepID=A0AA35CJX6_9FIRM|nr:ABC transporter ATP-binding protein [Caldinitratiruptor microaerophilus]BDG60487.1 ABC transporter ATP-binding protein [Caldinitratiruptor microaerophilus]